MSENDHKNTLSEYAAKAAYEEQLRLLFNSPVVPDVIKNCLIDPKDELSFWTPNLGQFKSKDSPKD